MQQCTDLKTALDAGLNTAALSARDALIPLLSPFPCS